MISTNEAIQKYAQTVAKLPNVSTDSFEVSLNEDGVRQIVKAANRVTGIDGVKSTFGLPWHSHALLQDTSLHARIQVHACGLRSRCIVVYNAHASLVALELLALQSHALCSVYMCTYCQSFTPSMNQYCGAGCWECCSAGTLEHAAWVFVALRQWCLIQGTATRPARMTMHMCSFKSGSHAEMCRLPSGSDICSCRSPCICLLLYSL